MPGGQNIARVLCTKGIEEGLVPDAPHRVMWMSLDGPIGVVGGDLCQSKPRCSANLVALQVLLMPLWS